MESTVSCDHICERSFVKDNIGAFAFISILLLSQGVESNPGPWSFYSEQWLGMITIATATAFGIHTLSRYLDRKNSGRRTSLRNEAGTNRIIAKIKENFLVSSQYGFLLEDPVEKLPKGFEEYENLAQNLTSLVDNKTLREKVDQMKVKVDNLDIDQLSKEELILAHIILSFITMGYVWQNGDTGAAQKLPQCIAIPLCKVSEKLGTKPILCYSSMILGNWKMAADSREHSHEMQNLRTIYDTPGGDGSSWFVLTHNCIEQKFSPAIELICLGLIYAEDEDTGSLTETLKKIPNVFKEMETIFKRIEERLEPAAFYGKLRLFYAGWDSNSKALPNGLIYEGVNNDKPMQFVGGSAAQSATLQILDAALGIKHEGEQGKFIEGVRDYMLKEHREFIKYVEYRSLIRTFASESQNEDLKNAYNKCIRTLANFRRFHCEWIVKKFILQQQQRSEQNKLLQGQGTGGTPLGKFLNGVIRSTESAML